MKKLESLLILERARLIFEHGGSKYLRAYEWQELSDAGDLTHKQVDLKVGDVYSGAGSAVAHYNFREGGLLSILSDQLSNTTVKVVKELVLHQLVNSSSKSHFIKAGKSDINKQRDTVSAMKALEQYNQTAFWEIEVNPSPVTDEKTQTR